MKQHDLILNYLKRFKTITPYEAFKDLGITKLATRISEMKQNGYQFADVWVDDVNRFGENVRYKRYSLIRRKDWSEYDLLYMSRSRFTGLYDVTNEEYDMLIKQTQEM